MNGSFFIQGSTIQNETQFGVSQDANRKIFY